jgi:glycerol-3-phosphate acyltransferase PlsY
VSCRKAGTGPLPPIEFLPDAPLRTYRVSLTLPALFAFAYLCGSIPTGVWLSRRRGLDPRDLGSGNIGATNVARTAGTALGVLTLLGDTFKGLIPVLLANLTGQREPLVALTGLAAFGGHLYPCFLRFRGGKGVATGLGVLLGLAPLAMTITLPLFAVIAALTRYVSLASLLTAAVTPLVLIALGYGTSIVLAAVTMSLFIFLRHRDNIRRLRFGTEARIGRKRPAPSDSGVA